MPSSTMFRASNNSPKPPAAPHFPTFLLPALHIPFMRRRQSSATTTSSSSPTSLASTDDFPGSPTGLSTTETHSDFVPDDKAKSTPTSTSKREPLASPSGPAHESTRNRLADTRPDLLRCNTCGTDVAYGLQIVSKGFTGRHGRALLVAPPLASPTPSCPGSPLPVSPKTSASSSPVSPGHHTLARESANLVNITVGRPEPRNLVTGAHVVADISCSTCGVKIGWKYVDAREQAQKYKVGKFILETQRVVSLRSWEDALPGKAKDPRQHFYSSSAPAGAAAGAVSAHRRSSTFSGGRKESCSSDGSGRIDEASEGEDSSGSGETDEEIVFDSDDSDECEDIFAGVWDAATVARRRGSKVSGASRNGKKVRAAIRDF